MQQRPATTANHIIHILHKTMQFASVYNELFKALSVNGNQVITIAMIQAVSMAAWTGVGSMPSAACAHAVYRACNQEVS